MADKKFTQEEVKKMGSKLGAKLSKRGVKELKQGLEVELEHGSVGNSEGPNTNITKNDTAKTAKIAMAHIKEAPHYYTALKKMEKEEKKKKVLKTIVSKHKNGDKKDR